ncbi:MAG TPA: isochorismatase family protein [Mesorhizobium sp.]|jgi:nicotinamidase-related amidase|nr:isochorismatase family protein [Mesorhizobium sp.]
MIAGAAAAQGPGLVERADSALFVIDVQDGFLRKLDTDKREAVIDNCRFLVEVAKRLDIPSIVTVEEPALNGPTIERLRRVLGSQGADRDKRVFGLCGQDDLRATALAQPRRTAVLIGLETDVCVLHSAVGLKQNGFRAIVVSDATGAPGAEHATGLARATALGIEVIHAKGLFYEWARSLDGLARIKAGEPIVPPRGTAL